MSDDWLEVLPVCVGQIFVSAERDGRIAICHRDDIGRTDLTESGEPDVAMEIARVDDAGAYRPLKTAPNLRHGWKLVLASREQARVAFEHFYPGRGAAYRAWRKDSLRTTPLRETLARQSGMYRVAAKISDQCAAKVIANVCRSDGGCLRTILWQGPTDLLPVTKFDPAVDQTGRSEPTLPLLCQESCNILVAELRKAVKA